MTNHNELTITQACDGWHVRPLGSDPAGIEQIFATQSEAIAYVTATCQTNTPSTQVTTPRAENLVTPDENKIT